MIYYGTKTTKIREKKKIEVILEQELFIYNQPLIIRLLRLPI